MKRLPDGSPLKYKARYCVRGDVQKEGMHYFETYAPVVQWSTIWLVLTMILSNGWSKKQDDYTNAFVQADITEKVYIDYLFLMILHLSKSMKTMKHASNL